MKIIHSKAHGILDLVVVTFLLISPSLFNFSHSIRLFTYALGLVHLTLTLITDFPLGLLKIISFKFHGLIELAVSIILIAFPFILKLDGADFYYYVSFGAAVLITWALTKYE